MPAPAFWETRGLTAQLLSPLGSLFGAAGSLQRCLTVPAHATVPVICVGNLVAGGAGKTPVVLALTDMMLRLGRTPHILTRGYGGSLSGPVMVDSRIHEAASVGDEALLLAAKAPTWVARNRRAGASAIAEAGGGVILMDDGMQNPTLHHDWDILVVDGSYGFGNGRLMPAGPLRETIASGLARSRFAVLIGNDRHDLEAMLKSHLPVLRAQMEPVPEDRQWRGERVVAFAGIGRPDKFFATLCATGADIVARQAFPDHHPYRSNEVARLAAQATEVGATLVTTEKDWVRLPAEFRDSVAVLRVKLAWEAGSDALLLSALTDLLTSGS